MCGAKTPAGPRSRERSCPAAVCGGHWQGLVVQHLTVARVADGARGVALSGVCPFMLLTIVVW